MSELYKRLEDARRELAKAHEMHDWDWILSCSMDVYLIQREIETWEEV